MVRKAILVTLWLVFGISSFQEGVWATEPRGVFDGISNYQVNGWAYDPDEPSKSILVHVYIDGPTGGEGLVLGAATANTSRNDVNAAYGITGNHGFSFSIPERYRVGYHTFYVYAIDSQGGVNPLIAGSPKAVGVKPSGNAAIIKTVLGSPLTIRTYDSLGGAIGSLTWKGVEFIDRADHGRELQTASHFDGYGECYNPTEAGSASDGVGTAASSTQLQYLTTEGNVLHTRARMAYWLRPGERSEGCSSGGVALNTTRVSNYILDKQLEIGYGGMENVIRYDVTIEMPEARSKGVFEVLTGYMPSQFNKFYSYDLATKTMKTVGNELVWVPTIFATGDGQQAMGIYTPLKQMGTKNIDYIYAYYLARNFGDVGINVTKWNTVMTKGSVVQKDYKWRNYVVMGTLDQVKASMDVLYLMEDGKPAPTTAIPTTDTCPKRRQGDANCDGKIDLADFALWKQEYLGKVATKTTDFDGGGLVGLEDFGTWKKGFLGLY